MSFIEPIYLQYRASETEERSVVEESKPGGRRRNDTLNDEDDFIPPEKRKKLTELSKSYEKDLYGVSPGFNHL